MLVWYFKLDLSDENWATFKARLQEKADSEHFAYLSYLLMGMTELNNKLKEFKKNDTLYL